MRAAASRRVAELRDRLTEIGKPRAFGSRSDLCEANAELARWERRHPAQEREYRALVLELARSSEAQ